MDGRRDKVGQRLSNGSEQVPGPLLTSPRPPVGGERVTVRASATEDTWFSVKRGSERGNVGQREGRREVPTRLEPRFLNMGRGSSLTLVFLNLFGFVSLCRSSHWSLVLCFLATFKTSMEYSLRRYFLLLQMKRFLLFQ